VIRGINAMNRDTTHALQTVMHLLGAGNLSQARQQLHQIAQTEPQNAQIWLMLAHAAGSVQEKRAALWRALRLKPDDRIRGALAHTVDAHQIREAAKQGVFICYTHHDELFALDVADTLRSNGIAAWVDIIDVGDDDWNEAVAAALQRCGLMLVVASPAALRSDGVRSEVERFMSAGKIALPLVYQPCDARPLLLPCEPIDFTRGYTTGLNRLVSLLSAPNLARHHEMRRAAG
jgi:hypothetical protein